ncbi:MAG: hypothetical protein IJU16_08145 [Clostridia bacterium]|nr:hypothetical protein [Clostridia bacterium]
MNTFHLIVSSPDGNLFDGDAYRLILRGAEGDLAVMAGHIPFITSVQPGECRLELPDETTRVGQTDGGLLTVSADVTTLLSGSFTWTETE